MENNIEMNEHSFDMLRDFFEIEISSKTITDELIDLLREEYEFNTTKEELDDDLYRYHLYLI